MTYLCERRGGNLSQGFITLISVLIVGTVGLAITVSLLLLGSASARTSFAYQQSHQAKALTNACAEEALQQIRDATLFTGTGNLTFGRGTCYYTVTNQGFQNRTIIASGTVGSVVRKVNLTVAGIVPSIVVSSWQEVADF